MQSFTRTYNAFGKARWNSTRIRDRKLFIRPEAVLIHPASPEENCRSDYPPWRFAPICFGRAVQSPNRCIYRRYGELVRIVSEGDHTMSIEDCPLPRYGTIDPELFDH